MGLGMVVYLYSEGILTIFFVGITIIKLITIITIVIVIVTILILVV